MIKKIHQLKNIIIDDILSYYDTETDEYINVKVLNDFYVSNNAIHVFLLEVLWTDKQGDISKQHITCEKRASWLYENASVIEKNLKGKLRRKKTKRKRNLKRQKFKHKGELK